MNFCPKDLCEKLVKMGCKSESGDVYSCEAKEILSGCTPCENCTPAFTLEDVVANTEQAKENARIVWGDSAQPMVVSREERDFLIKVLVDDKRHKMIDAPDPWKFLEETMRKE